MNTRKKFYGKVYTPDAPPQKKYIPKKKPYVVFEYNWKDEEDENGFPSIYNDLLSLGIVESSTHENYITVTGSRKIIRAIDIFLSLYGGNSENNKIILQLNNYKKECENLEKNKLQKSLPPKSKDFSLFKEVRNIKLINSSYNTYVVQKNDSDKRYIYKENWSGRSISEIEAFNGLCYRALLGKKRHPKTIGVHKNGRRIGVLSKLIPEFTSIYNYVENKKMDLTKEKIVESEMIKVWVAAYTEEETDLHTDNYGFDKDGFCVKIDDDKTDWSLNSKFIGVDPEKGAIDAKSDFQSRPAYDFVVKSSEIASFPYLKKTNMQHWFDKGVNASLFLGIDFNEVMQDEKFINDKYFTFLKRALMPREMYEANAKVTISSEKTRKKRVDHKCKKTAIIKRELLGDQNFQKYLMKAPQKVLDQIVAEITEYNNDYKKPADAYLKINIDQIEKNFNEIYREVYLRQQSFFKRHPILTGIAIGLGVMTLAIGVAAAVVFSGGLALAPFVAAAATVGVFMSAGVLSGTAAAITGTAIVGAGVVAASVAAGAGGGAIVDKVAIVPSQSLALDTKFVANRPISNSCSDLLIQLSGIKSGQGLQSENEIENEKIIEASNKVQEEKPENDPVVIEETQPSSWEIIRNPTNKK